MEPVFRSIFTDFSVAGGSNLEIITPAKIGMSPKCFA